MLTTTTARLASRNILRTTFNAIAVRRSHGSTVHGNDPEVLESEKKRNLDKKQHETSTPHSHAPGWNEHLASISEAYVKADKSKDSPGEMQQKTVDYLHARHSAGDKPQEDASPVDGVKGPLFDAIGREPHEVPGGKKKQGPRRTEREGTSRMRGDGTVN